MPFQPILQSEWCQHEILCKLLSFCLVNLIQQPSVQWHLLLLLFFGLQLTALVLVWVDPIQVKKRNRQISYWKLHFIEFKIREQHKCMPVWSQFHFPSCVDVLSLKTSIKEAHGLQMHCRI